MSKIDTTNILQNFLKKDPYFNKEEVLDSNKSCLDEEPEDTSFPCAEENYDDLISEINKKYQQGVTKEEPEHEEEIEVPTEDSIEELVEQELSPDETIAEVKEEVPKEPTDDIFINPLIPLSREDRKSAILMQKSLEEKIARDRIAFEEELKKKEEELLRIKAENAEKEKRKPFFFGKKEKALPKRERDSVESGVMRKLALFDQKLNCKNANAYNLEINLSSIPQKDRMTFIYCDINNLKKINDTIGHEGGDLLLLACVNKMIARFTENQVFRIGGDEFCIIYHPTKDAEPIEKMFEEDLLALAEENPLYSFSYGYAVADGVKSISELQKEADTKMYVHKEAYKQANKGNSPQNDRIQTVKDIVSSMVLEFKKNEDTITNIFLCTYKDQLFVFDTTLDFFDQLEDGNYQLVGKNQIKYCLITYDDNREDYLVFTEEPTIENPFPILKSLDSDIRTNHNFTGKNIKKHKELSVFKEVYLS